MSDEEVVVEEGIPSSQNPLVSVTFQRDSRRKEKYLEAEPKALGITQIGLGLYKIIGVGVLLAKGQGEPSLDITLIVLSLLVVIAGYVAVSAQNLHLPKLRACLGMQIVSCVACIVNMIFTLVKLGNSVHGCWVYTYDSGENNKSKYAEMCHQLEKMHAHFFAGGVLIQAALLAISVTLAAYCCKVVNCCGPAPKMPMITVQTPQRAETNQLNVQD
ncbi:uncharacterized protein LOC108242261 isoform X1 [Kryptolebias marmoratus]|uniref:Uncharacterized LOC108242261 n=1 Tax=Kryptolebias marmoratus TaxID=37003 RepID=A0A3Q3A986_KRYMA|nr:uncharacterized protein LOC108242261 isoform X1 [Kryptolebias marmoratus]